MNKVNNIFNYVNICDCPTSSILEQYKISNINNDNYVISNDFISNNSIIVAKHDNQNSYSLYYNSGEQTYLLSYIIAEGNGLYNYEKYHSLFFNIDDDSIQESYNKIFVNTNFINTSNDISYNYGISYINNTYLCNKKTSVTLNNDIISYFYSVKNKMEELYEKYKSVYKQISYYNDISISYSTKKYSTTIYDYKDVNIKYIDNYYFSNGVLNPNLKNYHITLPKNSNTIYYKNINLLNIYLEVDSDYLDKNSFLLNTFRDRGDGVLEPYYEYPENTDINAILTKTQHKNSQFTILNSNFIEYTSENSTKKTTLNNIYLESNINSDVQSFEKYGGEISICINPSSLSYIDKEYINYNINYDTVDEDTVNNITEYNDYILSEAYSKFKTTTKFIPIKDNIKICLDNRNIEYGVSFYNSNVSIKNSYLCLINKSVNMSVIRNLEINENIINKLLEENIIWYNYDDVLHYGYNYSYICDNINDNLYENSRYVKNYYPIFQNISTKIINFDFLVKYNRNPINIDTIDVNNTLAFDMNSFIYADKENSINKQIYLYAMDFDEDENKIKKIKNKIGTIEI